MIASTVLGLHDGIEHGVTWDAAIVLLVVIVVAVIAGARSR